MIKRRVALMTAALLAAACLPALGADWPQFGGNAARNGVLPQLPEQLYVQWSYQLPARKAAWVGTNRMRYDTAYEPVVAGKLLLVGCEYDGSVLALDTQTGQEKWRFFTDGAVRWAPACAEGKAYVGTDMGMLYGIDLASGKADWTFNAAPRERKLFAHGRLASPWAISGGPAVADGMVVFTAGHWALEGTYLYALDARSGQAKWSEEDVGSRIWDYLSINNGVVSVRGMKASYDLKTGQALPPAPPPPRGAPRPAPATAASAPAGPKLNRLEGTEAYRVAGDDKVFVTTREGRIFCFGANKVEHPLQLAAAKPNEGRRAEMVLPAPVSKLLAVTGQSEGYCVVAGLEDGRLVEDLLLDSRLQVIALDPDAAKVQKLRAFFEKNGHYVSRRLTILTGDLDSAQLPAWSANIVVSETGQVPKTATLARLLHPFGGTAVLPGPTKVGSVPADMKVTDRDGFTLVTRPGALAGAAEWTHEFANPGNTLSAHETLVKVPLGLQWYGGPAGDYRYYFDGVAPYGGNEIGSPLPPQAEIVEGKWVLQGPGVLAAFDAYTGRFLWEQPLPKTYVFPGLGVHDKAHAEPWHQPGGMTDEYPVKPNQHPRSSGYNYVSMPDVTYVGAGEDLLAFDTRTGKPLLSWKVPVKVSGEVLCWGNLRVMGNVLVATAFRPSDLAAAKAGYDGNGGDWAKDRLPHCSLFAMDRASGKLLWSKTASIGFLSQGVALGKDRVFAIDLISEPSWTAMKENGRSFAGKVPMLYAWDLATGKDLWSAPLENQVRQLTYVAERDFVLAPCRFPSTWKDGGWDTPDTRKKGMPAQEKFGRLRCFKGADGSVVYDIREGIYAEPHAVLGDLIMDRNGNPFDLLTGKPNERINYLTGQPESWGIQKHGCNHLIISDALVTWRTGFYDLLHKTGGTDLVGMEAGCTPTFIPSQGLLNGPNFGTKHKIARTTAVAMIHDPENDFFVRYGVGKSSATMPIVRAGFNFGTGGDRLAPSGTMWLGVTAKVVPLTKTLITGGTPTFFDLPAGKVKGATAEAPEWMISTGVIGATELAIPMMAFNKRPDPKGLTERAYTVRLHFIEPEGAAAGQRVFTVSLQGDAVLKDFDVARETGGPLTLVMREFKGINAKDTLAIALTPAANSKPAVLCGVEVLQEKK